MSNLVVDVDLNGKWTRSKGVRNFAWGVFGSKTDIADFIKKNSMRVFTTKYNEKEDVEKVIDIVNLYFKDRLNMSEIAELEDISETTVRRYVNKFLTKLIEVREEGPLSFDYKKNYETSLEGDDHAMLKR